MSYKNIFFGSAAAAVLLLTGCGTPMPPAFYVMPDPTQPAAQLKINRGFAWLVKRRDVDCSRLGQSDSRTYTYLADFRQERRQPWPSPYFEATLPAGLSAFRASYSMGDKTCLLDFDSLLAAGRKYEMKLDIEDRGFFKRDLCKAVIVDAETGAPAPTFTNQFKNQSMFAGRRSAMRDEAGCRRRAGLLQSGSM
jgi:hypothetical protein